MAKDKFIVNGYSVPTGYSGVAVRRACELVVERPGITQKELLDEAVRFSGLNFSTAGWLTSPGPKSPATILWDRRKEGVFKCYPNEFTDKVLGAQEAILEELIRFSLSTCKKSEHVPVVGELLEVSTSPGYPLCDAIILGFSLTNNATMYPTVQALLETRPFVKYHDRVEVVIMENGTGRRRTAALGWHYRPL